LNKIILFYLSIFCLALVLYSCSDSPTSVGNDLVKRDLVGVNTIDSYTDSLSQTSSYFKHLPIPGTSDRILLGKAANLEAKTLMSFSISLPDTISSAITSGSVTVTSATIEMTKSYIFGDSLGVFNFNGYECTSGWTSLGFTADSLSQLTYNPSDIVSNEVLTDTNLTFNIDKQLVTNWLNHAASTDSVNNKGIILDPSSNSQMIIGFQSEYYSNPSAPVLSVVIQTSSYTDTLLFGGYDQTSVFTGTLPNVNSNNIVVQSGLALRAKLKFDLSKVPSNVVLNNAELVLKLDSLETMMGTDSTNTIILLKATQDTANDAYDSTQTLILTKNGNTVYGNVTSYVQQWLKGNNYGFILAAENEMSSADLFSIHGSNYPIRNVRPRLTIYYTYKK
jgi:hypothetical protein